MAEHLDDGEFWLPPQFLTDDDTPVSGDDNNNNNNNNNNLAAFFKRNDDVSRAMFSYLSSPVESSETESSDEEEQYMAELTRRVAHSTLELDLSHSFPSQKPKGVVVNGSPQSTLCGFGFGCGCGCGGKGGSSSSVGSPNSACHVTSQGATWDLLRAAAGEVERMRLTHHHINDNTTSERRRFGHNRTSLVVPPRNPGLVAFNSQYHHSHSLTHQQLQIAQFEMLRQQQLAKQQQQQQQGSVPVWCGARNSGRYCDVGSVGGGRNVVAQGNASLCASAWPPLQQQHAKQQQQQHQHQQYGSGMRAVFLGNPKRESAGTGVFLPRRIDSPVETKKQPGCSTVLVPARVVQALNLKLEDMVPVRQHQPCFNGTSNMENAARVRSNYGFPQQKRNNLRPQPPVKHEIPLPQEWTY